MPSYLVKTNKVGELDSSWPGQVAYRTDDLAKAWRQGLDLECYCASQEPLRMLIPNNQIYTKILRRQKFAGKQRYGRYELAYFVWQPSHNNGQVIPSNSGQQVQALF